MQTDTYGQRIYSETDLCSLYMQDPTRKIQNALVDKQIDFDDFLSLDNLPKLVRYVNPKMPVSSFDKVSQDKWFMPQEYYDMDIAAWILNQCKSDAALQRAGAELLEYQARDMFRMLQYLKYLVDTMRKHNVVWGVGRGSSVASYVLFLIGIHKIDSLYYDLPIDEFLK